MDGRDASLVGTLRRHIASESPLARWTIRVTAQADHAAHIVSFHDDGPREYRFPTDEDANRAITEACSIVSAQRSASQRKDAACG